MKSWILIGPIALSMAFSVTLSSAEQGPVGARSLVILYTSDTNGQFEVCD
ncbi:uncharacterized protein METZ01_LOCUS111492 [marine metagenome]|uniref:Uncharacterized protein n=1 Tax=marine metagenome TaxID=408172 RepID=A0A381X268_9ZZZZ